MDRDQAVSVLKFASLTTTALFAGGAVYINIAEHPARRSLTPAEALIHWSQSYDRASVWQASNAAIGLLAGLGTTYLTGERAWAISGAVLGSVIPFTLVFIMPVNKALKQGLKKIGSEVQVGSHAHHPHHHGQHPHHLSAGTEESEEGDALLAACPMWTLCFGTFDVRGSLFGQVKTLLRTWGALHGVRSALGLLALGMLASKAATSKRGKLMG